MCGKPLKFATLPNFAPGRCRAACRNRRGWMNSSPSAMGRTGASSSMIVTIVAVAFSCISNFGAAAGIRTAAPGPDAPSPHQPSAKPPRPEAMNARSRRIGDWMLPVAAICRCLPDRPRSARHRAPRRRSCLEGAPHGLVRAHARASAPRRRRPAARFVSGRSPRGASARAGSGTAQFTRQSSTSALSQRPSRMSVSVMRVRRQHALGVLRVDRKIGARPDLRGGEAALGHEVCARRKSSVWS